MDEARLNYVIPGLALSALAIGFGMFGLGLSIGDIMAESESAPSAPCGFVGDILDRGADNEVWTVLDVEERRR